MDKNEKAVLTTLCYSDIFDFPLTKEEIEKYLISEGPITRYKLQRILKNLLGKKKISLRDRYYCLTGREQIFTKRKERKMWSREKLEKSKKIASLLAKIPTVQCIGISGSLSMNNAKQADDIDICIIAKAHRIWTTRLLVVLLLELLGIRRQRQDKKAPNKICVNMWIDESALELPQSYQNLYIAHEVIQLVLLINKNETYQRFMKENVWVKKYLPNAYLRIHVKGEKIRKRDWFIGIESLTRFFQLLYMNRHITSEYISSSVLAFHPKDYKSKILKEYNRRVNKYV